MKVSETVTLVFTRGTFTAKRELTIMVIAANRTNRTSRCGSGMRQIAKASDRAPQTTMAYRKAVEIFPFAGDELINGGTSRKSFFTEIDRFVLTVIIEPGTYIKRDGVCPSFV